MRDLFVIDTSFVFIDKYNYAAAPPLILYHKSWNVLNEANECSFSRINEGRHRCSSRVTKSQFPRYAVTRACAYIRVREATRREIEVT